MVLWFTFFGIAAAAIVLMIVPLYRRRGAAQPRTAFDAQIYRDQLAELELDAERGDITPEQAASARAEIARRLLAVTPENEAVEKIDGSAPAWRGVSAVVAIAVPVAAFGVYTIIGSPHLPGRPASELQAEHAAARTADSAHEDSAALVEQLGEKLKGRPDDLRGWTLYAQSLMRLGRYAEAVAAYERVTKLAPKDVEFLSRLAEAQIFAAQGAVTPEARRSLQATLTLDEQEPRARYYLGLAESQAGRTEEALRIWIALEADSPPNAPWRATLTERIARLAAQAGLSPEQLADRRKKAGVEPATETARANPAGPSDEAAGAPRGPTTDDVSAAQAMAPQDRMVMIRGMVAGLAERLKDQPKDLNGWQRLARSYDVLGELEKARDAYGHLAEQQPDDVKALSDYAAAIARTLPRDGAIPQALAELGDRILNLDPRHTGALWFTGMARAQAGDWDGAKARWTRLLAELDANSEDYAKVKDSIETLEKLSK